MEGEVRLALNDFLDLQTSVDDLRQRLEVAERDIDQTVAVVSKAYLDAIEAMFKTSERYSTGKIAFESKILGYRKGVAPKRIKMEVEQDELLSVERLKIKFTYG